MTDVTVHTAVYAFSLAVFILLWPVSLWRKDASVVDLAWAPCFGVGAWIAWERAGGPMDPRVLLALGLITLWSLRLTGLMVARKRREQREDPRYGILREAWEPGFAWKSLFLVFALQATILWALLMPFQRLAQAPSLELGPLAAIGAAAALFGLGLETLADRQLARFKAQAPHDAICETGLWGVMRHPNYLGEIIFWWGVWVIAAPTAEIWIIGAPLLLTTLVLWVSGIPFLDDHMTRSKPGYADYKSRVPAMTLRFWRRPWPTEEQTPSSP